jgi:hypothetical protein
MNLDGRDDRLREWLDQLPNPWPFPDPERFAAIDGRRLATPPQWRAGNGAWGCYRSHLLILEKCLLEVPFVPGTFFLFARGAWHEWHCRNLICAEVI